MDKMIYLFKYPSSALKSYNKMSTESNRKIIDINNLLLSNGISTILLYRKKLRDEYKNLTRRGISSLDSLDINKIDEKFVLILHPEIITNSIDSVISMFLEKEITLVSQIDDRHITEFNNKFVMEGESLSDGSFHKKLDRLIKINSLLEL